MLADETEVLLEFLTEKHRAGAMDHLTYEPGTYEFNGIRLVRATRSTWKYSPAIKELQEAEQGSGAATRSTTEFWTTKLL